MSSFPCTTLIAEQLSQVLTQAELNALSEYAAGTTRSQQQLRELRQAEEQQQPTREKQQAPPPAMSLHGGPLTQLESLLEVRVPSGG